MEAIIGGQKGYIFKVPASMKDIIRHECYFLMREADLKDVQEKLAAGPLNAEYTAKILKHYVQFIGETFDMHFQMHEHERHSPFRQQLISESWVMVSMMPEARSTVNKCKEMEAILLKVADIKGLFATRKNSGYGLFNELHGHSSTYFNEVVANPAHADRGNLLLSLEASVLWGIQNGKKLYSSQMTRPPDCCSKDSIRYDRNIRHNM